MCEGLHTFLCVSILHLAKYCIVRRVLKTTFVGKNVLTPRPPSSLKTTYLAMSSSLIVLCTDFNKNRQV